MAQFAGSAYAVVVASAVSVTSDGTRFFQFCEDPLDGPFCDPHLGCDVTHPHIGIMGQAHQHVTVVAKEGPCTSMCLVVGIVWSHPFLIVRPYFMKFNTCKFNQVLTFTRLGTVIPPMRPMTGPPPAGRFDEPLEALRGLPHGVLAPTFRPSDGKGPLEQFAQRAAQLGLKRDWLELPAATLNQVMNGHGVLASEGAHGSLVVVDKRRGPWLRVRLGEAHHQWMRPAELAKFAGFQSAYEERKWLHVGPDEAFDDKDVVQQRSPLRRTWSLMKLEQADLWIVGVYGVGVGLLSLAVPVAVQALVNTVAFGALLQPLVVLALLVLFALTFSLVLSALQAKVVENLQRRLIARVGGDLARRLPHVEVEALDERRGPELVNQFFDVFACQKAMASLLVGGLDAVLVAAVGMLLLGFYHPMLLIFDVVLVVAAWLVFHFMGHGGVASAVEESRAKYKLAAWFEELARHRTVFRSGEGSRFAEKRANTLLSKYLQERDAHFRVVFRQYVSVLVVQVLASVALLGIGGMLVIERELSIGQLVAAELVVTAVVASLAKLGGKIETFYDLVASVDKLGELWDLPIEGHKGEPHEFSTLIPLDFEVKSLHLKGDSENQVISGRADGADAAVAYFRDASRASALVETLFGVREARGGQVLLGDIELRDVNLLSWRRAVSVIRDEDVFPSTVADYLRSSRSDASLSDMWSALERVGLDERIRAFPRGMHSDLVGSEKLSRSETVRLSVARALVGDARLIIVDRAFDTLDEEEAEGLANQIVHGGTETWLFVTQRRSFCTWHCRQLDVGEELGDGD